MSCKSRVSLFLFSVNEKGTNILPMAYSSGPRPSTTRDGGSEGQPTKGLRRTEIGNIDEEDGVTRLEKRAGLE